jgi:AcrR family transcriptional regulator
MREVTVNPVTIRKDDKIPPRERILQAASDLFYRQGIRAVGVESIAEAAGTNKMTLYRHFESKDELVAEYLRRLAAEADTHFQQLKAAHPGKPCEALRAWLGEMAGHIAHGDDRGCALTNAAVELPEKEHPARCVIEEHKNAQRDQLIDLCREAKLSEPDLLADELFLILEGARVTSQSTGKQGMDARLMRMGMALIRSHEEDANAI